MSASYTHDALPIYNTGSAWRQFLIPVFSTGICGEARPGVPLSPVNLSNTAG